LIFQDILLFIFQAVGFPVRFLVVKRAEYIIASTAGAIRRACDAPKTMEAAPANTLIEWVCVLCNAV